jgi:aminopeptidase N
VTYSTRSQGVNKFWLPRLRQFETVIDDVTPDLHLLVNVDRAGYYRVQYDDANWMLIASELSRTEPPSNISPISRAMLIHDAATFLADNSLRARIFLELIRHLEHDVRASGS